MNRSQAREQAFLLLFEKSFSPETEIEDIIENAVEQRFLERDDYVLSIVPETWDKLAEIDSEIEENLRGWKMNRISRVSLAALRLAVCEMLYEDDIPISVSINEAVELCKKYAEAQDASFVNGVLGSVAKKIQNKE
ncbi:MAG: transcription antitermination factor NusB [Clostridia bacterium]|nr:transcription antitermination factor NusB [Clostridia bacterium]